MNPLDTKTADALRKLGLNQSQIARGYGISKQRVNQILKGNKPRYAKECLLYFVLVDKYIKIGITNDLEKRLKSFSLHCPLPIKVLGIRKANRVYEKELHMKFQHLNHFQEWFKAEPELLNFIEKSYESGDLWCQNFDAYIMYKNKG